MTKQIPFLKNPRIATVKKWVYEERRGGSRTGRLFQKCLIKLFQNLTQSFSKKGSCINDSVNSYPHPRRSVYIIGMD